MSNIKELFDQIIEDGVITREEHDEFMDSIHADGEIDPEESEQISRMFRLIQSGQIKVVDEEREAAEARRKEAVRQKMKSKLASAQQEKPEAGSEPDESTAPGDDFDKAFGA